MLIIVVSFSHICLFKNYWCNFNLSWNKAFWAKGVQINQNNGPHLFLRVIIATKVSIHCVISKIVFSKTMHKATFDQNWHNTSLNKWNSNFIPIFENGDTFWVLFSPMYLYNHSLAQRNCFSCERCGLLFSDSGFMDITFFPFIGTSPIALVQNPQFQSVNLDLKQ